MGCWAPRFEFSSGKKNHSKSALFALTHWLCGWFTKRLGQIILKCVNVLEVWLMAVMRNDDGVRLPTEGLFWHSSINIYFTFLQCCYLTALWNTGLNVICVIIIIFYFIYISQTDRFFFPVMAKISFTWKHHYFKKVPQTATTNWFRRLLTRLSVW